MDVGLYIGIIVRGWYRYVHSAGGNSLLLLDHAAEGIAWRHFMPPLRLQATKKQEKISTVIYSQEGLS